MRVVVDHHVDRPGVEAQQCVKLTGTNHSIGLIFVTLTRAAASFAMRFLTDKTKHIRLGAIRVWMTWWLWRGA